MTTELATALADSEAKGYDPDAEYIDWSNWEEGDSVTAAPEPHDDGSNPDGSQPDDGSDDTPDAPSG